MRKPYYSRRVLKIKEKKPAFRRSDRFPTHKKPHRMSTRDKVLRDWKRLGKDIEKLEEEE
jgi:hypothetical protein